MPMMKSQILKSGDFLETKKSRYFENETLFFLQVKKVINYTTRAGYFIAGNGFIVEITFKKVLVHYKKIPPLPLHSPP